MSSRQIISTRQMLSSGQATFIHFPQLPLELRLVIWSLTLQPRVVEIRYSRLLDTGFKSSSHLPVALQICQESRSRVLDQYPFCFGSKFHPANIRFSFALDTLYIPGAVTWDVNHLRKILENLELSSIKHLAISANVLPSGAVPNETFRAAVKRAVEKFTGLEELLIVFDYAEMNPGMAEAGEISLFDKVPHEFSYFTSRPVQLPNAAEWRSLGYDLWSVPTCRPVCGWRRPSWLKEPRDEVDFSQRRISQKAVLVAKGHLTTQDETSCGSLSSMGSASGALVLCRDYGGDTTVI
jgi:hypothetical protein